MAIPDVQVRSMEWNGDLRHLLLHPNGEETLVVEMVDETRFSTSWSSAQAFEKLEAMGWREVDPCLPEGCLPLVERRLAEARKRPSEILRSMGVGPGR